MYKVLASAWLFAEFAYYFYFQRFVVAPLQPLKKRVRPTFRHPSKIVNAVYDMLEKTKTYTFSDFCSGWFYQSDLTSIYVENFESFLACKLYSSNYEDLNASERAVVSALVKSTQTKFNAIMTPGSNSGVQHARFCLEPMTVSHFPLILRAALMGVDIYSACLLRSRGFKRFKAGAMYYWVKVRPHTTKPPVMLIHGVTLGWFKYIGLIDKLMGGHTVILLENHSSAISSTDYSVPQIDQIVDCFDTILKRHGFLTVSIFGHSWGTFLMGIVVKMRPACVHYICFIEPISLMVVLPDLTYALFCKPVEGINGILLKYFVRHNLVVQNNIYREFAWYNMAILFDEIPKHVETLVCIAERDFLIKSATAVELTDIYSAKRAPDAKKITRLVFDGADHGDIIATPAFVDRVVQSFWEYEATIGFDNSNKTIYCVGEKNNMIK